MTTTKNDYPISAYGLMAERHWREFRPRMVRELEAEVKAIASGNPMVIEKAQIDAEVIRLNRLRRQHMDGQHSIRLRIGQAEHNIAAEETFVANLQQDLATRTPTRGDEFTMTIEGKHYDERVKAGRQLVFIGAALKPFQSTRKIGSIAGFPISLHRLDARVELLVHGCNTYQATVSDSPQGTIASLEHALGGFESQQAESRENLERLRKRIGELTTQLQTPFEHQETAALGEVACLHAGCHWSQSAPIPSQGTVLNPELQLRSHYPSQTTHSPPP